MEVAVDMLEWDASVYDSLPLPHKRWGAGVLDRLKLTGDETVLEIGCGTGRDARTMLDRHAGLRFIGVDGSRQMLDEARARLAGQADRARLIEADVREPLDIGERVDAAYSVATLHWLPDHRVVFATVAAALRSGGRFVAECGGVGNISAVRAALGRLGGDTGERVWNFATAELTTERLSVAGFTEIDVRLVPDPARFAHADQFEAFLATVVLGAQLRDMAPADRRPFVKAVAADLAEPAIDYVRLQIRAVRR